jgi:putative drug exporter of the RND superfamily
MMVFAIVFGLSMDYEVFLLSRVHESWLGTGDPHRSVAIGIGATARVITTAAGVMVVVFLSFVLQSDPSVKMLAVGMAAAVLIDASIVRMVLVPAIMSLLGRAAWWLPRWLEPVVPRVELEEADQTPVGARGR